MTPEELALAYLTGDVKAMPGLAPEPVDLTGSVMLEPQVDMTSGALEEALLQPDDIIPWNAAIKGLLGLGLMAGIKPAGKAAASYVLPEVVKKAQQRVVEPVTEAAIAKFSPEALKLYQEYLASLTPTITVVVKK